jgi:hypothetical protein
MAQFAVSAGRGQLATAAALFLLVVWATRDDAIADVGPPPTRVSAQTSAEEELALKYNPILKLTEQTQPCTKTGNVYNPAPVDIILENPDVELRRLDDDRTVIKTAPTAEDVAGLDEAHDLNWPGNPRRPGCVYEQDYLELVRTLETQPTAYAHIATEDGVPGIAVQYWYNYYYNDFANKHEGDWEMVQVMFDDAGTVEEALQQEPTRTAYSGHAGGEIADWTDEKLEKVGIRPVVYVTTGAHAAHYSEGTFIGVAKRGQVFGCDPTVGPHRSVDPEVVMLPDEPPTTGEFAWLTFAGLWGEESGSLFSGIAGPAVRERWYEPFTWANDLRDFSDRIPDSVLGIDPVGAICAIVNTGSDIMLFYGEHPFVVVGGGLIVMGGLGSILVYGAPQWLTGRPSATAPAEAVPARPEKGFLRRERPLKELVRGAIRIYAANWPLWMVVGLAMIPASLLVMFLDQLVGLEWLMEIADSTAAEPVSEIIGMTLGALIGAALVSVAVFAALREFDEGTPPSVVSVFQRVLDRGVSIIGQIVLYTTVITVLSLTILGIPLAINRAVAWGVAAQTVVIEDRSALGALSRSSELVRGNWLRVLGTIALIALFVGLPGPLIAFGFLVFTRPPIIETVYPILTMLYVLVLFPVGFIASGLLYGDLCAVQERRRRDEAGG